jgi:hypothetical protein
MARWHVLHGPHSEREDAEHTAEMMSLEGYVGLRVVKLRDKPQPHPLVTLMMAAAHHEGRVYSHMVQRSGAWLLASNGRHVVGVECSDVGPSAADATIAAKLRDQVPDFAPVYTARVRDLLSHTPLVNVAGVVVPAESLRLCLAVLPEGVKSVGVMRMPGDGYNPQTMTRVRDVYRLALSAPGWRATISPMLTAEKCPAVALRECKKGKV